MTASLAPDPPPVAPQAISEQHTMAVETIQERELWRFWMLVFFFAALTAIVLIALVVHQALQLGELPPPGAAHQGQSPRGAIVDRNGALLAADRFFYQVTTTPKNIKTDAQRLEVAKQLEELAGIPATETLALLTDYKELAYLELAKTISLEQGERILAEQGRLASENGIFPLLEINLTPTPKRYYPEGNLGAHLVGMVAINEETNWLDGYYGLEGYYNNFLRQRSNTKLTTQPDAELLDLPADVRRYLPSVAGKDLILTIDRRIQWIIEDELRAGIDKYGAKAGTIIVMAPKTGAILALANWPAFDPNDVGKPGFTVSQNAAISAQYEPGSVFKVITAAAVLDTGVITPAQKLTDTGSISVGSRVILNSTRAAWGAVDMTEALARSLNVITAQWALLLGKEQFYRYVNNFGFGQVSEVDLAGEVYGLVKQPGSADWSTADLGTNSFGQGVAVTPIQMINSVAAIANGGKLMRPYVVQSRVANGKLQTTEPTVMSQVIKPETAATLAEVLVKVVDLGDSAAAVAGYSIAGKSGTAQIPTEEGYTEDETIVTFVGYAPADDPQFVMLVKLDRPDPTISQWANYTAAPVFGRTARRLFDHLNIPPDAIRLGKEATP